MKNGNRQLLSVLKHDVISRPLTCVDPRFSCHVIDPVSQIRVPKLEGVWGWCPGCPGRWGVAEIRVLFLWLEMTGCPAALDAPVAD